MQQQDDILEKRIAIVIESDGALEDGLGLDLVDVVGAVARLGDLPDLAVVETVGDVEQPEQVAGLERVAVQQGLQREALAGIVLLVLGERDQARASSRP